MDGGEGEGGGKGGGTEQFEGLTNPLSTQNCK